MMRVNLGLRLRAVSGALLFFAAASWAGADTYPSRPIRMIVPYPAGGGLDTVARVVGRVLSERLQTAVAVDNRGGASGVIGVELGARAIPDGYTILFTSSDTLTVLPLMRKVPFDAGKDLTPIAKVADLYIVFTVHPKVPAQTLGQLIALAKARPGQIRFASPGLGSVSHMTFEAFKARAGVDIQHIPFNGGGPAQIAAIGGQVEVLSGGINLFKAINAGQLRGLAVTQLKRSALLPGVPTVAESGFPNFDLGSWFGFFVPSGVPRDIVAFLVKEISAAASTAEFRQQVGAVGGEAGLLTGDDFDKYLQSESLKWRQVVEATKIKLD